MDQETSKKPPRQFYKCLNRKQHNINILCGCLPQLFFIDLFGSYFACYRWNFYISFLVSLWNFFRVFCTKSGQMWMNRLWINVICRKKKLCFSLLYADFFHLFQFNWKHPILLFVNRLLLYVNILHIFN